VGDVSASSKAECSTFTSTSLNRYCPTSQSFNEVEINMQEISSLRARSGHLGKVVLITLTVHPLPWDICPATLTIHQ
jgi:hypothetical protein